jgi:hypothetical protein
MFGGADVSGRSTDATKVSPTCSSYFTNGASTIALPNFQILQIVYCSNDFFISTRDPAHDC